MRRAQDAQQAPAHPHRTRAAIMRESTASEGAGGACAGVGDSFDVDIGLNGEDSQVAGQGDMSMDTDNSPIHIAVDDANEVMDILDDADSDDSDLGGSGSRGNTTSDSDASLPGVRIGGGGRSNISAPSQALLLVQQPAPDALVNSVYVWSPRHKDSANARILQYLGIELSISTNGTGHNVNKEPYRVVVTHRAPTQRTFSRSSPPQDPLKLLLLKHSSNYEREQDRLVVTVW